MSNKAPSFVVGKLCAAALLTVFPTQLSFARIPAAPPRAAQRRGPAPEVKPRPLPRLRTPSARPIPSEMRGGGEPVLMRWKGQAGVERYRLQISRDRNFEDIVVDQAVPGLQQDVSVPPGRYFWRVAPAVSETGRYSEPQPVEITPSTRLVEQRLVTTSAGAGGWRTATGEMPRPVPARLRASSGGFDLVGVNTDGTVYALNGANGVALWTARYDSSARRGEAGPDPSALFSPLALTTAEGRTHVVVAFDGGLRALNGGTGREMWRAALQGRAVAGTVADADGDGRPEVLAVLDDPNSLVVLSGETGRLVSNPRLGGRAVGAPAALVQGGERSILVALADGVVEAWRAGGARLRTVKVDAKATTAPLVVTTSRDQIVVVGSERGLLALAAADLKLLGRIDAGEDAPRGMLTAADVEGDGSVEVLMVTRGGRVALIEATDRRLRWIAEGAQDADSVTLADLDGDGVLDVLAPAGQSFASGFSGTDGALIWRIEEDTRRGASTPGNSRPRALVITQPRPEQTYLVGGDPSRTGLRAIELPKNTALSARR